MQENNLASSRPADPFAPPPRDPPRLWHYAMTQWRRMFGLNVSCIDDLLFVGGEFSPSQWPDLYLMGVRAVLSLQAEREDQFEGTPPERALRVPVVDFHAPTIAQLHEAVAFIGAAHADGLPVLVHCHAGVGRASLTASAYLMSRGLGRVEAFERIRRSRPIVELCLVQVECLIEWEQVLRQRAS